MKNIKTYDEFVEYMWKTYPRDNQLRERTAMLKAWDFMSGKYDQEEIERNKIAQQIDIKLKEKGFK